MSKPRFDEKVSRPNGPWVPSNETDITINWAKAREKLEQERLERERIRRELDTKLTTLRFK